VHDEAGVTAGERALVRPDRRDAAAPRDDEQPCRKLRKIPSSTAPRSGMYCMNIAILLVVAVRVSEAASSAGRK
jgi:hypothetical protein